MELEGEARKAAMKAAREEFKAALAALREERKALREKYHLADANRADKALENIAKKNDEANQKVLAASEKAQAPEAVAEAPVAKKDPVQASEKAEKFKKRSGSTVSAQ